MQRSRRNQLSPVFACFLLFPRILHSAKPCRSVAVFLAEKELSRPIRQRNALPLNGQGKEKDERKTRKCWIARRTGQPSTATKRPTLSLQAMPITGSSTTRHGRNHRTIIQLPTCMIVEHQSGSGCNKLTYLEPHIHVS